MEEIIQKVKNLSVGFKSQKGHEISILKNITTDIKKGETVMIVEAMKTMNHVPSPFDGVVKEICVEDGSPVEFDQIIAIVS